MKLPQFEEAFVPRDKITDYLMSPTHFRGRDKSVFFRRFGFRQDEWRTLADALKRHAKDNDLVSVKDTAYGTRYTVEGSLETPSQRHPVVRSVWMVEKGRTAPRLVTAYPV